MEQSFRKYKRLVVFLGSAVVDQVHDEATFRGMGSSPATLEVAKAVDFYGCLSGHAIDIEDGEQAYVQAEMQGTPTRICLPHDQRPSWWRKRYPNTKKLVCRLLRAIWPSKFRSILGRSLQQTHICIGFQDGGRRVGILLLA